MKEERGVVWLKRDVITLLGGLDGDDAQMLEWVL